jgi:predicted ester cyclase
MGVIEQLTRLWTQPVRAQAEAVRAFGDLYTDPVSFNGTATSLVDLVQRARAVQRAFADLNMEIIDAFEAPDRFVIVFLQPGRHVGPLALALGEIPPTGRQVEVRTIDVLSMLDNHISAVDVVADNLGLAMQLGAVALTPAG